MPPGVPPSGPWLSSIKAHLDVETTILTWRGFWKSFGKGKREEK